MKKNKLSSVFFVMLTIVLFILFFINGTEPRIYVDLIVTGVLFFILTPLFFYKKLTPINRELSLRTYDLESHGSQKEKSELSKWYIDTLQKEFGEGIKIIGTTAFMFLTLILYCLFFEFNLLLYPVIFFAFSSIAKYIRKVTIGEFIKNNFKYKLFLILSTIIKGIIVVMWYFHLVFDKTLLF